MAESEERTESEDGAGTDQTAEAEERELHKLENESARQAKDLGGRTEELGHEIHDVRSDWERKRADPSVPGALPRDDDEEGD